MVSLASRGLGGLDRFDDLPLTGVDFTPPRVLFKTGLVASEFSQRFVATADGKQFLFNMLREGDSAATTTTLRVVLNWTDGLTQ